METYKFIIFIIIIASILIFYGNKAIFLIDNHMKSYIPKSTITEKFQNPELNAQLTMPDPKPGSNPAQYPDVDIHLDKAKPGDNYEYLETDKIYINPFYPDETQKEKTPTQNYKNPDEMSSYERNAFKYGYPNAMTMQDYVNWLYLYRNSPDLLSLEHNINYQKLIKNITIRFEKGFTPPPSRRLAPLKAEDYFHAMYTQNPTQLDPLFTQTRNAAVRVASNFGDPKNGMMAFNYDEYPNFSQNFDVMGTTQFVYNNELAEKTDPYFLQKFVGPVWKLQKSSYFK